MVRSSIDISFYQLGKPCILLIKETRNSFRIFASSSDKDQLIIHLNYDFLRIDKHIDSSLSVCSSPCSLLSRDLRTEITDKQFIFMKSNLTRSKTAVIREIRNNDKKEILIGILPDNIIRVKLNNNDEIQCRYNNSREPCLPRTIIGRVSLNSIIDVAG